MKTALICAAAAALVGVRANAGPITITPGPAVHIRFADLDLNSRHGRALFAQRIRSAAETLCMIDGDRTADSAPGSRACYRVAVENGLQQMAKAGQVQLAQRQAATAARH
jgi:UrcA family protein